MQADPINQINSFTVSDFVKVAPINALDYGKKHEGCKELQRLVGNSNFNDIEAIDPFGIPSQHIEEFLRLMDLSIFTDWERAGKIYTDRYAKNSDYFQFLKDEEVVAILTDIQKKIACIFEEAGKSAELRHRMKGADQYDRWLEERSRLGHLIMVRSSGDEDSADLGSSSKKSVAGGSKSFASEPTPEEAYFKMGQVVASYFHVDSLQKRFDTTRNPFSHSLKLAVFSMQYIGEKIGGTAQVSDVPVSVVMFSSEPCYGNEKFRVTKISCCYGHGEGVVGNVGIATDSILVYQSKSNPKDIVVLYDNRLKPQRLIPMEDRGRLTLEAAGNPEELIHRRALSKEMVLRLFEFGRYVEGQRKCSTDMELVVVGKKIVPVQARDVNRKMTLPTFVDTTLIPSHITKIEMGIIVPGLCSAKDLTVYSSKAVLLKPTLAQAEKEYNPKEHQIVVVNTPEETYNSHPIVNFSELGVSCFYYPNLDEIQKQIDGIGACALQVCPQQALMFPWDEKAYGPVSKLIKEGFVSHPAPMAISFDHALPSSFRLTTTEPPSDLRQLFFRLRVETEKGVTLKKLHEIARHPALEEVEQRIKNLQEKVRSLGANAPDEAVQALEGAQEVQEFVHQTFNRIKEQFASANMDRFEFLFNVKILETAYIQRPDGGLSRTSVHYLKDALVTAEAMVDYQMSFPFKTQYNDAYIVGQYAITEQVRKEWHEFIFWVETEVNNPSSTVPKEQLEQFKHLYTSLRNSDSFPIWMLVYFGPTTKKANLEKLQALLKEFTKDTQNLLDYQPFLQSGLEQVIGNLSDFADPKKISNAYWPLYFLMKEVQSPKFTALFKRSTTLGQLILSKTLRQIVDQVDTCVKTIKMSHTISEADKLEAVYLMVSQMNEMFEKWAIDLIGLDKLKLTPNYFKTYIGVVSSQLEKAVTMPRPLQSSRDFDVSYAIVTTQALITRNPPVTVEDGFTLAHQNLLALLTCINADLVNPETLSQMQLPALFQSAIKLYLSYRYTHRHLQTNDPYNIEFQSAGLEVNENEVIANFNIPLRSHSSTLKVKFNIKTQQFEIALNFYGRAHERWREIIHVTNLFSEYGKLPKLFVNKNDFFGLGLKWQIGNQTELEDLSAHIFGLIGYSLPISWRYYIKSFNANDKEKYDLEKSRIADIIVRIPLNEKCNWKLKRKFFNYLTSEGLLLSDDVLKGYTFSILNHPLSDSENRRDLYAEIIEDKWLNDINNMVDLLNLLNDSDDVRKIDALEFLKRYFDSYSAHFTTNTLYLNMTDENNRKIKVLLTNLLKSIEDKISEDNDREDFEALRIFASE